MKQLIVLLAMVATVYTFDDMMGAYTNGMLDGNLFNIQEFKVVGDEGICSINLNAKEIDCIYGSINACRTKEIMCGSTANQRMDNLLKEFKKGRIK